MATQNSNPDNHAFLFESLVILKNKDLLKDLAWSEMLFPLVEDWIPSIRFDSNRTIVTKDKSIYKMDIWMNIASITPVKIRHKDVSKFISEIQSMLRYLVLTIKTIGNTKSIVNSNEVQYPISLINEVGFKLFVYLSTSTEIPGFEKRNTVTESIFKENVGRRNIEYVQLLKFNDKFELVQESKPNFFSQNSLSNIGSSLSSTAKEKEPQWYSYLKAPVKQESTAPNFFNQPTENVNSNSYIPHEPFRFNFQQNQSSIPFSFGIPASYTPQPSFPLSNPTPHSEWTKNFMNPNQTNQTQNHPINWRPGPFNTENSNQGF